MCLWPNHSIHPPERGKNTRLGQDPNKLQRSLEIWLRHKAASLLQDKLAVTKKHWGPKTFPELWLYLQWKGVSHAVSFISTNMLTTFSMLKSSHRPLKSWSIHASKSTTCWANTFQCRNQYPDYNMALSCIQLLKQTLMSQYETYLSCSQQIGKVPIYTFNVLQVLGLCAGIYWIILTTTWIYKYDPVELKK